MSFGPIELLVVVVIVAVVVAYVKRKGGDGPVILPPEPGRGLDDLDEDEDDADEESEGRMRSPAAKRARLRRTRFEEAVQAAVVQGWSVESRTDYQAVLVRGQRVNHILHLILTILTLGIWAIVWIILALAGGQDRQVLTVDRTGGVSMQKR